MQNHIALRLQQLHTQQQQGQPLQGQHIDQGQQNSGDSQLQQLLQQQQQLLQQQQQQQQQQHLPGGMSNVASAPGVHPVLIPNRFLLRNPAARYSVVETGCTGVVGQVSPRNSLALQAAQQSQDQLTAADGTDLKSKQLMQQLEQLYSQVHQLRPGQGGGIAATAATASGLAMQIGQKQAQVGQGASSQLVSLVGASADGKPADLAALAASLGGALPMSVEQAASLTSPLQLPQQIMQQQQARTMPLTPIARDYLIDL